MASRRALLGAAAVGSLGAFGYALWEARRFVLREYSAPVLPRGADPIRVLHLSDMHLLPSQRAKIEWVRALAEVEPDLVIDTGDNWAAADSIEAVAEALEPLLALPGAFVWGSNDYFLPTFKNPADYLKADARTEWAPRRIPLPVDELGELFRSAGWKDLTNRRDTVVAAGRRVSLVGVDDPHLDRDRYPAAGADVAGPRPAVDLRLGVAHAPYIRVLDQFRADACDLILAGHTHGGQLCLPGIGTLVTNCDLDRHRAKGLHGWPGPRPDAIGGESSAWLHVSAGLGTSPYAPVRFACRPEASLLTLTGK